MVKLKYRIIKENVAGFEKNKSRQHKKGHENDKRKEFGSRRGFRGFSVKRGGCRASGKEGLENSRYGSKKDSDPNDTDLMFHRVGLRVGAMISEGEYERALLFCGTGIGIHIAARRAITGKRSKRTGNGRVLRRSRNGLRYCRLTDFNF